MFARRPGWFWIALCAALLLPLAGAPSAMAQSARLRPGKRTTRTTGSARKAAPAAERRQRAPAERPMRRAAAPASKPGNRLAGGPLRSGTYRVTRDNSHSHLSGPLTPRGSDKILHVMGDTVTFGGDSGVLSGMTVKLQPRIRYLKGKPEITGWEGTGQRYNPQNHVTDTVSVWISGHPYRSVHPGLRQVSVSHQIKRGFDNLGHQKFGGAAWRPSGAP